MRKILKNAKNSPRWYYKKIAGPHKLEQTEEAKEFRSLASCQASCLSQTHCKNISLFSPRMMLFFFLNYSSLPR